MLLKLHAIGATVMFMLLISSALLGAIVGLRFKVLVLLPALFLLFLLVLGLGVLRGESLPEILLASVVGGTGLQLGYLCGAALAFAVAAARLPRPASLPSSANPRATL